MKARDQLRNVLLHHGWQAEQVDPMLDAFAHELAEQQRAALPDVMDRWLGNLHQDTISEVINLIDPLAPRAATTGDNT